MREIRAASLTELPAGHPTLAELNGTRVVLTRAGDAVHACGDVCAHQGGPLSQGKLTGTRLACPWHGWIYDVRTGQCVFPGRGAAVPAYRVRIDADDVWVEVP